MTQGDIAIIGMACLFPGSPGLGTYWQNILSKVNAITDPPPEAWDEDVFYDPGSTANDRVYCKRGGFIGPLAYFNPLEHGIMPLAVEGGEPDQWLALQVARDAFADAGYSGDIPERHRAAVILGKGTYLNRGNTTHFQHGRVVQQILGILQTLHPEYAEADLRLVKEELRRSLPPFNADTVPGLIPNIAASRIANRLDLMGPSYTIDAACASSLLAVDTAMRGLCNREYDLALVGGVHVVTPVPVSMLFCQLGALSRQEEIRPFDEDADGTILGEGIGMVVLKRREDAERDGNRIYAVIKGVGVSSDGRGVSVVTPRVEGEVLALQRAYGMADISPRTVGLIEAHGTGTPVGDATEIEALTRVFGPRDAAFPWCSLGSVKSMIGHLMPAAGIAGLIKAALALYHRVLPPTLNVSTPNPRLDSGETPFHLITETRPWIHGAQSTPRRAGVNAFGFGGVNAHVVLEEYPVTDEASLQSHQVHWDTEVCILSAESRPGMIQRAQQLQQFLQAGPQVHLRDLAYTLNVPLDEGPYRLTIVASTLEDLEKKLDRALERLSDPECHKIQQVQGIYFFERPLAASGQLAFLFPGEGSQYTNMLADLCLHFPEVREQFDLVDRVFGEHTRHHVPSDFIFPRPSSEAEREVAELQLWQMEGAVTSVLTASRGLLALLTCLEIHPDAVVGHSTGEYSAMLASGMIDVSDETLLGQFATELNRIYQQVAAEDEIPGAALVAVGAGFEAVSAIIEQIGGDIYVAMDNCPHQTVIVGKENTVEQAIEQLRRRGLIYERLPFDRPYHTPLFEAFAARLQAFFARWLVSPPQIQVYSCTTMSPFPEDPAQIQALAVEHWLRPVEFRRTIEAMHADGVRIFVEVGPRGNLTAFVDDILRGQPHIAVPADVTSRSGTTQLNHLVGMLAAQGVPMQLNHLYARRLPRKLSLDRPEDRKGGDGKPVTRMKLATGWPPVSLSEEVAARLRSKTRATATASPSIDARTEAPTASSATPVSRTAPSPSEADKEKGPTRASSWLAVPPSVVGDAEVATGADKAASPLRSSQARPPSVGQVMSAHLRTMEQFLAAQQEVMQAFLNGRAATPADSVTAALPAGGVGASEARYASQEVPSVAPVETPQASPSPIPAADGLPSAPAQALALLEGDGAGLPTPAEASQLSAQDIGDMLLRLVSERTGYPIEMLDLGLDLEADLGIDSIKRVEVLGAFQRQIGLTLGDDMDALASRKTLQGVIDFLTERYERPTGSQPVPATDTARRPAATATLGVQTLPFPGKVISETPGEELVALCEISLDEHVFLQDHTLGRRVSVIDPELKGLPVVPLTVSMEIMAEVGALLAPGQRLVGMRDVRAYRWTFFDGDELALQVVARRTPSASRREIHVQMREADAAARSQGTTAGPIIEGTMIFGDAYPEPPVAGEFALREERPSSWAPGHLYEDSLMFHGPAFRGVASMDRLGEDGAEATLKVLPVSGLFRSDPDPRFITDPVLLDQLGQVVGFWGLDQLESAYVIFPFHLEELRLYGPNLDAPRRVKCRARIALIGEQTVRSDLDVVRPDDRVWLRFVGWEDRRFNLPHDFFLFVFSSPRDTLLSEPWSAPSSPLPVSQDFQAYRLSLDAFPEGFFSAHGGIWRRVLAHTVLSQRERDLWRRLRTPPPRQLEWLLGRVVAKDAVRQLLKERYDLNLCPADIEILPDNGGQPLARGPWAAQVPHVPLLSISHSAGVAVAVAAGGEAAAGVGVDLEVRGRMSSGMEELAFAAGERELLSAVQGIQEDDWPLRFWCAKEAVAKAWGQGLVDGPRSLVVKALDTDSGAVQVGLSEQLARRVGQVHGDTRRHRDDLVVTALTAREGDLVTAVSVREGG